MSDYPALITNKMIWEELKQINSKIDDLYQRDFSNSTGIISLNKLCKRWGKGREFIKDEVRNGRLKAKVKIVSRKSQGVSKPYEMFSFALQDVLEYERDYGDEKPEEIPVFIEPMEERVKKIIETHKLMNK